MVHGTVYKMRNHGNDDDDNADIGNDDHVIYLNNAAMARLSEGVQQAGIRAVTDPLPPVDDAMWQSIRHDFAAMIGAHPNDDSVESRIAMMPSTAYAMTFAARNLARTTKANLPVGGSILVLQDQFCSAIYPWQDIIAQNCNDSQFSLEVVPYPRDNETWTELIMERLMSSLVTAAVCLPPLHWSDGSLIDLIIIGEMCHSQGIPLIVDATQAVGAMPLDIHLIQPAMLCCSVHKWLRAPSGMCLVYIDPMYHDSWMPLDHNSRGRDLGGPDWDAAQYCMGPKGYPTQYMNDARKFNAGGKANPILIPMLQAALHEVKQVNPSEVQSQLKELARPLLEWVQSSPTFVLPRQHSYHIMGLRPKNRDKLPLQTLLELRDGLYRDYGIVTAVRAGALRISPYVDNSVDDMNTLVEALTQLTSRVKIP